jgi:hypothetical protein
MYIYIYFYGFITVFASRYVASLVQPLNPLS